MVSPNKIGVSMLYCLSKPFAEMTSQIPCTGTHLIEIVDEGLHSLNKRRVSILKEMARSYELTYTVHAPFAGINIAVPSDIVLHATIKRLKQSLANAAQLDCTLWVMHPALRTGTSMFYPGEDWARNMENVRILAEYGEDHGVKVGLENGMDPFILKNVHDFQKFYEEADFNVKLVLDTGHANLSNEVVRFISEFPEKVAHVHAHDNKGKVDEHLPIGSGSINWVEFAEYIQKIQPEPNIIIEAVDQVQESLRSLTKLLC
jgi:sugar phosphate isomerase/epimerase